MDIAQNAIIYSALFVGLYFQVFLLLSFLSSSGAKKPEKLKLKQRHFPSVSVIVPCYNEEGTVERTLRSLLALSYPEDKLKIIVVDDGSRDNTWQVIQQFKDEKRMMLLQKQNEGSKYHALNHGLRYADTDLVGCLDADSTVDVQALRASVAKLIEYPDMMCVMPAMTIESPKTIWQHMQKVEYEMLTFGKHVLYLLNAVWCAPGPFTLFRKSVFDTLGGYEEAHHTEDLEICLRMINHGMKIGFAENALVYTHGPATFRKLVKQRIRWIYGFVKNMQDYSFMLLRRKFGHIGLVILPISTVGIWAFLLLVPLFVFGVLAKALTLYERFSITGFHFDFSSFSWFYINTTPIMLAVLFSLCVILFTVFAGRTILKQRRLVTVDIASFALYSYASMVWTTVALLNALRSKKSTWR